jgi:hypothetical protein
MIESKFSHRFIFITLPDGTILDPAEPTAKAVFYFIDLNPPFEPVN